MQSDERKKLFIVDNADTNDNGFKEISGWKNTKIVLTSRTRKSDNIFQTYFVDFLDEDSCVELFYHYYKNDDERSEIETVKKLSIEMAKKHTFTIELLAKSANVEPNLREYYKGLWDKGFSLPDIEVETDYDDKTATVAQHLRVLFDMQKISPEGQKILWDFAVLPDNAYLDKNELNQWFGVENVNDVEKLVKSGWINREGAQYTIHPIIKEIVKLDEVPKNTAEKFFDFVAGWGNYCYEKGENYKQTERKLEYAISVMEIVKEFEDKDGYWEYLFSIARAYEYIGKYKTALKYFDKNLKTSEKLYGTEHPSTGTSYNNIAGVYQKLGKYAYALEYHKKAIEIS